MNNIYISIVIPVYNAENFIETAVQSILRQQCKSIEVILVNDGSNDNSKAVCENLEKKNQCVKHIFIPNSGAGHARNIGIDVSQGKWVMFLDSDDMILKGFFSDSLIQYLDNMLNKGVDIIYTPKVVCDYGLKNPPAVVYPENKDEIQYHIPSIEFWSCIYRRDFLNKKNVRFFEYRKQDVESAFRFRAFSRTNSIYIDREHIFYVHRDNPDSNVNTWNENILMVTKARVFHDLYQEFNGEVNVESWLYTQFLFYSKELICRGWKNGLSYDEIQMVKELLCIEKIKKKHKFVKIKYQLFECLFIIMRKISFVRDSFCKHCLKKNISDIKATKTIINKKDNLDEIFMHLDNYKELILQEKNYE